jgi:hypothetical protein
MPGKSGYEVCEAIKADPELRHIPVLLLTGTFEAFDEEQAARVGAAGHVAKPFEAQTLVDRVNELLAASPPPAPATAAMSAPKAAADPAPRLAGNDDSFDFFDDDLSDVAAPTASTPDPMPMESEGSAFSFGVSDVAPVDDPLASPLVAAPASDHTVAILPDDAGAADFEFDAPLAVDPVEVPPTALSADLDDRGYGDPADELLAVASPDDDDSFVTADATGTADESFDFSFDGEAARLVPPGASAPLHVEAEDVAQATVLDPRGASGYDVSSSDLGDPFAGPTAEPMAPSIDAPQPGDATQFLDLDAPGDDEPIASVEMVDAPAVPVAEDPICEAPPQPPEAARSLTADDAAARTDSVLAEITPQIREQIHDTLEKIAWESFGDVTEKVVAEVVDRIEKVAWEVIPQLTEKLVKAEIRRMKGESEH